MRYVPAYQTHSNTLSLGKSFGSYGMKPENPLKKRKMKNEVNHYRSFFILRFSFYPGRYGYGNTSNEPLASVSEPIFSSII
jgi:hypothetical protein